MLVKIGDKIYDSKDEPIMIVVQDGDKQNMFRLDGNRYRLCIHSGEIPEKDLKDFMRLDIDPEHGA